MSHRNQNLRTIYFCNTDTSLKRKVPQNEHFTWRGQISLKPYFYNAHTCLLWTVHLVPEGQNLNSFTLSHISTTFFNAYTSLLILFKDSSFGAIETKTNLKDYHCYTETSIINRQRGYYTAARRYEFYFRVVKYLKYCF